MSPLATPGMIKDFGRRSEGICLESIRMGEHVALFDYNTFGYPSSKDGRIPVPAGRRQCRLPRPDTTAEDRPNCQVGVKFSAAPLMRLLHDS